MPVRDIIIPRRRDPRTLRGRNRGPDYRRKPSAFGKIFRFLLWLFVGACILSAAIMLTLRFVDPPTSSFIELNKRNNNWNIQHQWVAFEQVSAYLPVAIIAAEDQRFPEHFGFDVRQIKLAYEENNQSGGIQRGASTLTQQTVKNLFLWPGRSFIRKGIEAWLTIWMELIVPKKRILELYVNFAQFGTSVFGAEAAAQHYFNISASRLNPKQSALLASALPTPVRSNPAKPSKFLLERTSIVLDQMPRIGGRRLLKTLD